MAQTFYFYDVETTGVNPRSDRIMQFAGQRTDASFNRIGEPDSFLIKLSDDILPQPDAVLITGITPQHTLEKGITEAEFLKYFNREIAIPDTVFVGFNSVRFDDEFIRFLLYRNYYDAYEWQWKDGRSRWDLLDAARITRALRPDGINWPDQEDGTPTNRLEALTTANGLEHINAHDALSDVNACIDLALLLKQNQPKIFDYLLALRDKHKVRAIVESDEPFVYTSGRYENRYQKTTVAWHLAGLPNQQNAALVYDLRYDPGPWLKMTESELANRAYLPPKSDLDRLPVKAIKYNCCPAVAPLAVLDADTQQRLEIDLDKLEIHRQKLAGAEDFINRLQSIFDYSPKQEQLIAGPPAAEIVDSLLYDGFIKNQDDQQRMRIVRMADSDEVNQLPIEFDDPRLKVLFPLYKARNFADKLNDEERQAWQKYREHKLMHGGEKSQASRYFKRLSELSKRPGLTEQQKLLLEDLQAYGQQVLPFA